MPKNMPKLGVVLMAAVSAVWMGNWVTPAFADAPVVVTGQTQCWDPLGNPTACGGTGQDGEIQAGVPFPTPRFTDNSSGAVTDNLTGLIWLQNANCVGLQTWQNALHAANGSAGPSYGLLDGSMAGVYNRLEEGCKGRLHVSSNSHFTIWP